MTQQAIIGTDVERAAAWLHAGELVAIPTETVYGLAGNGLSPDAIAKIYAAKGRPSHNPLILHIPDLDRVALLAKEFPDEAKQLAKAFWPGPLTIVLPRLPHIPDAATGGLDTVGVRVPAHPLTCALLSQLDFPLAAPSANLSNRISPVTASHVFQQLGDRIPYILDGGRCQKGIESTIVSFAEERPRLLRLGSVSEEEIRHFVPELEGLRKDGSIAAPGMLRKHYSPLTLMEVMGEEALAYFDPKGLRVGILSFGPLAEAPSWAEMVKILSPNQHLEEAAHHLYAAMHEMDGLGLDLIIAIPFPEKGLGISLNDRLKRAAER